MRLNRWDDEPVYVCQCGAKTLGLQGMLQHSRHAHGVAIHRYERARPVLTDDARTVVASAVKLDRSERMS